jgi:hypothetical protein
MSSTTASSVFRPSSPSVLSAPSRSSATNISNSRAISWLTDPFFVFSVPFLFAWLYLITPNVNYWFYSLVKEEYWAVITTVCYSESVDVYYPGFPDNYYNIQYISGISLPMILKVISWFGGFQNDFYWNTLVATSPVLSVVVSHGIAELNGSVELTVGISGAPNANPMQRRSDASTDTSNSGNFELGDRSTGSGTNQPPNIESSQTSVDFSLTIVIPQTNKMPRFFWWLPRYCYRRWLGLAETQIIRRSRGYHWILVCCFLIMCNMLYMFNMLLSFTFREIVSLNVRTYLFQIFIVVGTVLRAGTKMFGMKIDKDIFPQPVYGMIIGETVGLYLYYMFYRLLFEDLKSWSMFFIMQLMHLCSEWLIYPLRASDKYNGWLDAVTRISFTINHADVSSVGIAGSTHGDNSIPSATITADAHSEPYAIGLVDEDDTRNLTLQQKQLESTRRSIAVDFGLRFVATLTTGIGVLFLIVTASYVPWVHSELTAGSVSELRTLVTMVTAAVTLECINAYFINLAFARVYHISIWTLTKRLFRGEIRMCCAMLAISTSLLCAAMYAFSTDNTF